MMRRIAGAALAAAAVIATGSAALASAQDGPEFLPLEGRSLPFSQAVQVGDTLYLAGQIGLARGDSAGEPNGIEAETRRTMDRIGETLAKYGLTHDALFKCTAWLADIEDFAAFNAVYRTYFKEGRYPARSTMAVKGLAGGAAIEVECIAFNPQG